MSKIASISRAASAALALAAFAAGFGAATSAQAGSTVDQIKQRGIIRVQPDGSILVPRRAFGSGSDDGFNGSSQSSSNQSQGGIFQ